MHLRFRHICAVTSVALLVAGCGGGSSSSSAKSTTTTIPATTLPPQDVAADKAAGLAAALKLSDLPKGWTATANDDTTDSSDTEVAICLGVTDQALSTPADVNSPDFSDANDNSISNPIGYSPTVALAQQQFAIFKGPKVADCFRQGLTKALQDEVVNPSDPNDTLPPGVTIGTATVVQTAPPIVGDDTVGYRVTIPITALAVTVPVYVDVVIVQKGRAGVQMVFTGFRTPFPSAQEQHYLTVVVDRLTRT